MLASTLRLSLMKLKLRKKRLILLPVKSSQLSSCPRRISSGRISHGSQRTIIVQELTDMGDTATSLEATTMSTTKLTTLMMITTIITTKSLDLRRKPTMRMLNLDKDCMATRVTIRSLTSEVGASMTGVSTGTLAGTILTTLSLSLRRQPPGRTSTSMTGRQVTKRLPRWGTIRTYFSLITPMKRSLKTPTLKTLGTENTSMTNQTLKTLGTESTSMKNRTLKKQSTRIMLHGTIHT